METAALIALSAGVLAGLVHALAGPDHLSAVAPLVLGEQGRRWRMGLFWGIGHSLGVWAVGLLALALRGVFPVESLSSWSERMVGVVLIGLGLWGLHRAFASRLGRRHPHSHGEGRPARPGRAAVWIGGLHGLAGSSHLLGVLPALALPSRSAALSYVVGFGLGAVAAMTAFSSALGLVAARVGDRRGGRAYQAMLAAFSGAAVVVGGYWLIG